MRKYTLFLIVITAVSLSATSQGVADEFTFTSFDVPFAGATSTQATGINDAGHIVGIWTSGASGAPPFHGFLFDGVGYSPIDVPFAGPLGSVASGVNDSGLVAGSYFDADGTVHGFLVDDGAYTTKDVPFAGALRTVVQGINDAGNFAGIWLDSGGSQHGFLFDGAYSSIDVPFAGATDTLINGINDSGDFVGSYLDEAMIVHGFSFVDGIYSSMDVPFAGSTGTATQGINDDGLMIGVYQDAERIVHGFSFDGSTYRSIDVPFAGADYTAANGPNEFGNFVGAYVDAGGDLHGYSAIVSPKVEVSADSFAVTLGSVNSGGLPEIADSDDQYLVLDPKFLTFRYQLVYTIDAISPTETPGGLDFNYESRTQNLVGTVEQKIELFDYDLGQFETVDTRLTTGTNSVVSVTPSGDPARFVQSKSRAMQARISCQNSVQFWVFNTQNLFLPYRVRVDDVFWSINPLNRLNAFTKKK